MKEYPKQKEERHDSQREIKNLKFGQIWLISLAIISFIFVSIYSIRSMNALRGIAQVIHYTGFIGGASQMLVKEEVNGDNNDVMIRLLDEMIPMLLTGEGDYEVPVLKDRTYQGYMEDIREEWEKLKEEIYLVREGKSPASLYKYSEEAFEENNLAAYAAQAYMESYVKRIKTIMVLVYSGFLILMGVLFYALVRNNHLENAARSLNKIAYYDSYTGIGNKAYCDKKIKEYEGENTAVDLGVAVFDLNNLKKINDEYGHPAGDQLILNFTLILERTGKEYGNIGRIGGDEFIAFFEKCTLERMEDFMEKIDLELRHNNEHIKNPWDKISCAMGYAINTNRNKDIHELIKEADEHMYQMKRKMKGLN